MNSIAQTSWTVTCKICTVIRNGLVSFAKWFSAYAEAVGTARAAAELTRQGYYKEAKALYCAKESNHDA